MSTESNLVDHVLHKCTKADGAVQLAVLNKQASRVLTNSNSTAAATGLQQDIRTKLGGSKLTQLSSDERQAAAEHFMRFLITSNVAFQAMGNPHLIKGLQVLRRGYVPPSPTTFRTVLLVREYARCIAQLYTMLKDDSINNLTVSADCWTDQMRRSILAILVLLPDGTARLLEARDVSGDSHTGVFIAGVCVLWP
jgi:hypothetical protein